MIDKHMNQISFNFPDDNDPILRAYRDIVWENDALDQEPICAGSNILLLPRDSRYTCTDGRTVLYLDSRYAFGDGRHPTTILCLTLLEELLENLSPEEKLKTSMMDMGTGTGVLAILASIKGLSNILALDIDPVAIENARELAELNRCRSIDFRVMDAANLPPVPSYSLITANLLPPILRFIIPLAAKLSFPGSTAIFSGIGDPSRKEIESIMKNSGFGEIRHISSGWWHAYLARCQTV